MTTKPPSLAGLRRLVPWIVLVLLAAGGSLAVARLKSVLVAAVPPADAMFDHGLSVVDAGPPGLTNESCGRCHQQEYQQWQASRHAVAGTNPNFIAQCRDPGGGRQQWCLNCHAPNNPGTALLPMHEPGQLDALFDPAQRPDWMTHGVDCLSCHVRDGVVLATRLTREGQDAHPERLETKLGTAEFCAGCHQFNFKDGNLPDYLHGPYQQASLEEFLDFRAAGGFEQRCHACHMPGGGHLMPGGYDRSMLRRALGLDATAHWDSAARALRIEVEVSARRVGHRVPGGEHFRAVTLHTAARDADGKPLPLAGDTATEAIETFSRRAGVFDQDVDPLGADHRDTRLVPGETRKFDYAVSFDPDSVAFPLEIVLELRYHIMHETEAVQFGFSPEQVTSSIRVERLSVPRGGRR